MIEKKEWIENEKTIEEWIFSSFPSFLISIHNWKYVNPVPNDRILI